MYSTSNEIFHSGGNSLKLQFEGRNNFCNMCGSTTYYMASGYSNVNYFVDSLGTNLSSNLSDLSSEYAVVYNKDDMWNKWEVDSVANDTVNFVSNTPVQNDM